MLFSSRARSITHPVSCLGTVQNPQEHGRGSTCVIQWPDPAVLSIRYKFWDPANGRSKDRKPTRHRFDNSHRQILHQCCVRIRAVPFEDGRSIRSVAQEVNLTLDAKLRHGVR